MPKYSNGGRYGRSINEACVSPSQRRRLRVNDVSEGSYATAQHMKRKVVHVIVCASAQQMGDRV